MRERGRVYLCLRCPQVFMTPCPRVQVGYMRSINMKLTCTLCGQGNIRCRLVQPGPSLRSDCYKKIFFKESITRIIYNSCDRRDINELFKIFVF